MISHFQSKRDVEELIAAINTQVSAVQVAAGDRDELANMEHNEDVAAYEAEIKHLTSALLLKQSLGLIGQDFHGSGSNSARPSHRHHLNDNPKDLPPAPTRVVQVTSDDLDLVLAQMRSRNAPASYDFQGRSMKFPSKESPIMYSDGVTWRNGTIMLKFTQDLVIFGTDVVFEAMHFMGGRRGVSLEDGASLTMTDCEVCNCDYGVTLLGNSSLVADGLKVTGFSHATICLKGSSSASLTEFELVTNRSGASGIELFGTSSLVGALGSIKSTAGKVISIDGSSKMALSRCDLTGSGRAAPAKTRGINTGRDGGRLSTGRIPKPGSASVSQIMGEALVELKDCMLEDVEFNTATTATLAVTSCN